ncbi:MAG: hypothetical protein MJ153_05525 [Clostridia bacterium]|nr:hypothetical protein [Clostridia bacterium]
MGLLGDIFKAVGKSAVRSAEQKVAREAGRQIGQKAGEAVVNGVKDLTGIDRGNNSDSYSGTLKDTAVTESSVEANKPKSSTGTRTFSPPRKSLTENSETIRTAGIIRNELSAYSSYEIKEDYSFAGADAQNASFAIFSNGAPKLYIMLVGKATCSSHAYLAAKRKAASDGVALVNFVEHFANEQEYVRTRIAEYLN